MYTVVNIVLGLALAGLLAGGVALFAIARQDDSRTGQVIGATCVVAAILAFAWLSGGHHWL
ncbi:MAG TPA: hypothetical protein VGB91_04875 [Rhizomicrobium sp.]